MRVRGSFSFIGFAGIVLFLFGLVSYALTLRFDLWTAIHVAGGGVLLATGVLINLAGFRRTMTARATRARLQALTAAVLFGGILVSVNVLAARHPFSYDATENKIHTLSEKTRAVVSGLSEPLEILAFLETADPARSRLEELLGQYTALNPLVTWRLVDAEREPQLAEKLGVRRHGVLVARVGETSAEASVDSPASLGEGPITNLILKVTRPGARVIYVLTGHGEPSPEDMSDPGGLGALGEALRDENFQVTPLLLSATASVPEDAALLILPGSRKPLIDHEVEQLRSYLGRGGRVLMLLDPGIDVKVGPLLDDYRIVLGDDMIVDQEQIPFLGARLGLDPIVEDFRPHPITKSFKERIVLLQSRSVDVRNDGGLPGVEAEILAETRPASWAERDYHAMVASGRVSRDPEDRLGPIPVAAAAKLAPPKPAQAPEAEAEADVPKPPVADKEPDARLVVIGDSDLAGNANLDTYFNREFLLNTIQWLTGREELIAEGPRGLRPSRLDMTEADYRTLFRLGVLLLPESLLVLGLGIWWRRRSL